MKTTTKQKWHMLPLILALAMPNAFGKKQDLGDGEEVDIRACGTFEVKADLDPLVATGPNVCRTDDAAKDGRWRTKGAKTELHVTEADLKKAKSPKEMIDVVLLEMIREKVKFKLKAFSWVAAAQMFGEKEPNLKKKTDELSEKYKEFENEILKCDDCSPAHEVRRLLTLYPDIEASILESNPDYKPLICKYELRKHRQDILKKSAKIIGLVATIASLAGGPVTAYLWIPALPKVLMIAGGANILAGTLKIGDAVMRWDDVHAANTAKTMLQFNETNEKLIAKLKKQEPQTEETKAMVTYLQEQRLSNYEIDRLKNIKKLKRKEYTALLRGLMNTTLGAASIYGGLWANKQFGDFKATEPANVTSPYTPPTTGGGYSGPGGDDGG